MPGTYKALVAKRVEGVITPLGPAQEFQVTVEGQENMSTTDRSALVEFQKKAVRLQRAVSGATQAANALKPRLAAIKRAINETPSLPQRLQDEATALDRRTNEIIRALSGDSAARQRNMNTAPSINDRVGYVVNAQRMSTARPTQTQNSQYDAAAQDFEGVLGQLRQLIEVDLSRLEKQLEAAGAPWTPGRIPEWKNQ
jgi:chromosome segregation ATPase